MTENRLLRQQIPSRIRLSDGERKALAESGQRLGKHALAEVAPIAKPETILAWHRKRIAQKCDGSQQRKVPGRSSIGEELEALVVRLAQEHRSWAMTVEDVETLLQAIDQGKRPVRFAGIFDQEDKPR